MSRWRMLYSLSASTSAFMTDGSAPGAAGFAAAFGVERVGRGRDRMAGTFEHRRVLGASHCEIDVGAGRQLAQLTPLTG